MGHPQDFAIAEIWLIDVYMAQAGFEPATLGL